MAVDIIGTTAQYWMDYVFGSPLIAGIIILFFITLWGLRMGWSFETFIVLYIPLIFLLTLSSVGIAISPIWGFIVIGIGCAIGLYLAVTFLKR
jgi:hypothetical protein